MSANFNEIADYDDAIHIDPVCYENEYSQILELFGQHGSNGVEDRGNMLLDIACGTNE